MVKYKRINLENSGKIINPGDKMVFLTKKQDEDREIHGLHQKHRKTSIKLLRALCLIQVLNSAIF
jgi:hypothetical protein